MDIRFEPQSDYLRVVAKGIFDPVAARGGIVQIMQVCRERNLDRVLIDGRGIATPVSVLDRYEIAKTLADEAKPRVRMAVVVTRENMFSKTFEETARNMGMDVRTTESMAEALTYLGLPLST
jgi:G3E family GTPase